MSRLTKKDALATLELPTTATESEIRKSYLRLARKHHPDKSDQPDAEETFKKISASFQRLTDDADIEDDDDIYHDTYGDGDDMDGDDPFDVYSFFRFMSKQKNASSNPFDEYYDDDEEDDEDADGFGGSFFRFMSSNHTRSRSKHHPTESVGSGTHEVRTDEDRREWREARLRQKEVERAQRIRRQLRKDMKREQHLNQKKLSPEEIELQKIEIEKKCSEVTEKNFLKRKKKQEQKLKLKEDALVQAKKDEVEEKKRAIRLEILKKESEQKRKVEENARLMREKEEARNKRDAELKIIDEQNRIKRKKALKKKKEKEQEEERQQQIEKKQIKEQRQKLKKEQKKAKALAKLRHESDINDTQEGWEKAKNKNNSTASTADVNDALALDKQRPVKEWRCSVCTLINAKNFHICSACETPFAFSQDETPSSGNNQSLQNTASNSALSTLSSTTTTTTTTTKSAVVVDANETKIEFEIESKVKVPATKQSSTTHVAVPAKMWECTICTLQNAIEELKCIACDFARGSIGLPNKTSEEKRPSVPSKRSSSKSGSSGSSQVITLDVTCGTQIFSHCNRNYLQQHDLNHRKCCGIEFRDERHAKSHLVEKNFHMHHPQKSTGGNSKQNTNAIQKSTKYDSSCDYCIDFKRYGKCKWGNKCKHEHLTANQVAAKNRNGGSKSGKSGKGQVLSDTKAVSIINDIVRDGPVRFSLMISKVIETLNKMGMIMPKNVLSSKSFALAKSNGNGGISKSQYVQQLGFKVGNLPGGSKHDNFCWKEEKKQKVVTTPVQQPRRVVPRQVVPSQVVAASNSGQPTSQLTMGQKVRARKAKEAKDAKDAKKAREAVLLKGIDKPYFNPNTNVFKPTGPLDQQPPTKPHIVRAVSNPAPRTVSRPAPSFAPRATSSSRPTSTRSNDDDDVPNPRTSSQSAFVFACSRSTEEECFDLMLFGGTKALINDKRRCTKDIQFGTPLFLLNIQSDTVHGPFFAESGKF